MVDTREVPDLIVRDAAGGLSVGLRLELSEHTAQDVIDHLENEGSLVRALPDDEPLIYRLALGDRFLAPDVALSEQGVGPGDAVILHRVTTKGGSGELVQSVPWVIVSGSAAATVTALASIVRTWLQTRRRKITISIPGRGLLEYEGPNLSLDWSRVEGALQQLMDGADMRQVSIEAVDLDESAEPDHKADS